MEVRELPLKNRPRERLAAHGPAYLSDRELVAILIGSGIRGKGVAALADEVVRLIDTTGGIPTMCTLKGISGLGTARASVISAAFEFSRRILCPGHHRISFPRDILPLVRHYADRKQEYFLCISLNGAHEVIAARVVSVGLVNRTVVHPREVFADPLGDRAAAIICAHNHPSGNVMPSPEDREVTGLLKNAGKILCIDLLDHVIFSQKDYFSFQENGIL
ncbi:MAG: DNA repair protein RadC [Spirochaetales bacterium]|nr:DNA repair protein RadC [Spirochaetales bacterium]